MLPDGKARGAEVDQDRRAVLTNEDVRRLDITMKKSGAMDSPHAIQQRIQNPLATEILRGTVAEGAQLQVDYDGTDFRFEPISKTGATKVPTTELAGGLEAGLIRLGAGQQHIVILCPKTA